MASLLANLSDTLGKRRALMELTWMRHAAQSPHALQLMVSRRTRREPLQYILGTQPFGPLNILTRAPTLIPRPETEQWTTELATRIQAQPKPRRPLKMLDLCTGSGCIPLLLFHLLHRETTAAPVRVHSLGIDIALSACQLAHENILSSGIPPGYSLDIQQKNIFDDDIAEFLKRSFRKRTPHSHKDDSENLQLDIVTANPPYITTERWKYLPSDVKDWEDPLALLGDPPGVPDSGGLTFYKRIRDITSSGIMSPGCILAMELGEGQAADVVKIFGPTIGTAEVWKDWWGKERAVIITTKCAEASNADPRRA